jgi:ABC-2 type transport system ATP-binding protein
VRDAEAVRGRVGILTETPGLYDKLSAVANLDFFGRLYGLPADVRATRIERFLRLFDLWERRDDVAGTFSKGMKQKLAIARALLHEPAVVFLDEPTAALDPEAAFVVRDAIEGLRRTGRTIVLATHNLDEADRLCDRIAFVRGGLLRVDSPARLRGELGRRLVIRLAGPLPAALPSALAAAAGRPEDALRSEPARDDGSVRIVIDTPEPEASAPAVVRAAVGGGGDVIEVHPERTSLEQIYFDVMGVHPGAGGEAV